MNSRRHSLSTAGKVGGCYALGFISATHLTPLMGGPIAAFLTSMSCSTLLAALVLYEARCSRLESEARPPA
jgi:hypothetical protein